MSERQKYMECLSGLMVCPLCVGAFWGRLGLVYGERFL